jgi:hypothetical protein
MRMSCAAVSQHTAVLCTRCFACLQLVTPSEGPGDHFRTGSERSEASSSTDASSTLKRSLQPVPSADSGMQQQQQRQTRPGKALAATASADDAKAAEKAARRQARKLKQQKSRKDDGGSEQSEAATVAETPDSLSGKPFTHSPPR